MHSPEMVTVWTNLSALAFFSDFVCKAASAPRVAARKSAIARDSVIACPLLGQPFSHREATGGVSQTPSAGLNHRGYGPRAARWSAVVGRSLAHLKRQDRARSNHQYSAAPLRPTGKSFGGVFLCAHSTGSEQRCKHF